MNKIQLAQQLARYFGLSWILYRASYATRLKSGLIQHQLPAYRWEDRPLSMWLKDGVPSTPNEYKLWREAQDVRFFFTEVPQIEKPPIEEADAILAGRWRYFEGQEYEVGFPPNWHLNPVSKIILPGDKHWSRISDFDAGDIKFVWEASRFNVIFPLVRAYAATGDERYAAGFWQLIEDWAFYNPPQLGPNWKCGQETTFRLMAWCFGLYGFAKSPFSTPERLANIAAMIAAQAERIEGNIGYARSQKNNHGISEAVGLWTVGLLFPEFSRAKSWLELGTSILLEEMKRQIYPGGAYIQHSFNYHRVMLHDCLWALRLAEMNNRRLPDEVYEQFGKAVEFLYKLVDPQTGQVPNYGSNDGTLVLPLDNCDFTDYRPVVQAAYYLLDRKLVYHNGDWNEDLLWLFGEEAIELSFPLTKPSDYLASDGYDLLSGADSRLMIRCGEYKDRPAHADQLHVDVWWKGINIACDAGTYLYNGSPPWNNGLSATSVHNTVTVDNIDQMTRAGVFLWLDWANGKINRRETIGPFNIWEGEHDGYQRLAHPVRHRRGLVVLPDDIWLIYDVLDSSVQHSYRLHWLLPDFPYQQSDECTRLQTPAGDYTISVFDFDGRGQRELARADSSSVRGWHSKTYGVKAPALSLSIRSQAISARFLTLFAPHGDYEFFKSENILYIKNSNWQVVIHRDGGKIYPVDANTHLLEFAFK